MITRHLVPFPPAPAETLAETRENLGIAVAWIAHAIFYCLVLAGFVLAPVALLLWAVRILLG